MYENRNKITLLLTAALLLSLSACSTGTAASQTTTTEQTTIATTSETTEITTEETIEETTEETVPETTTEETTTSETESTAASKATSATSSTAKPAAESKDTKEFQAFYMSTFSKLTGKKPAKFKAKNPQPCTVYVIATGDGFEVDNKLKKFEDHTEEYFSGKYSKSLSSLEERLQKNDKTLYYTSDPNRASVIIICNRKYVESSRKYVGITAYDCIYSETYINTKTHKQKTFKCRTKPDIVLRVKSYGPYYCGTWIDTRDYDNFIDKVNGWFK